MIATVFAPPVQRAIRSQVYDALRRAIVIGMLQPGQRVNEAEIARQMQISRAPLREAIRQLEQDGLLVSVPRRGTIVVSFSPADVDEIYTLRADVESRAVRRAIERLTDDDYRQLERLIGVIRDAAVAQDRAALLEADIEFHQTIIAAAGWPQLRRIWESLHPRTLTNYTLRVLADWPPELLAERHRAVLAALRGGDPDQAADVIRQHIVGFGDEVMRRQHEVPAANGQPPSPQPSPTGRGGG